MARTPKPDAKLAALKESGTTNPHAHDVHDPAFSQSDFFDPRDLVQVRYEMLRRVRTEGQSIADATCSFGVSRPTFYKAQSDFARAGWSDCCPPNAVRAERIRSPLRSCALSKTCAPMTQSGTCDAHRGYCRPLWSRRASAHRGTRTGAFQKKRP